MSSVMRSSNRSIRLGRAGLGKRVGIALALTLVAACASPEEKAVRYANEAQEFMEAGDTTRAYIQYRNSLKQNEEYLPALRGLAKISEEREDFQTMFSILQRVASLDPQDVEAFIKLGKLFLISSDETSALEHAEKALALEPQNIDARSLKAGILLKIGNNSAAVELAREVLAEAPANPEAVTVVATDLSVNRDYEGALAELDRALAINPQIAMLQLLRIHLLETLGREDDAQNGYARLIELFPEQSAYRRVYSNELIRRGDLAGALSQLEKVVELEPTNLNAKLNVVRVVKSADGDAAGEAQLRAYIAEDSADTKLQFALVDYLIGVEDREKATVELETLAGGDDPDVALDAKNRIAALLLADGSNEEARVLIDEILEADERNTDALIKRAALQIDADEFDQAIVNLRTALDNSPDRSDAMILMSAAFEKQNNTNFARAELAKAFEASNRAPGVANQFSRFLLRQGDNVRAEEVLVESLAEHPSSVDNLKRLAALRLSNQDWRGAEEAAAALEAIGQEDSLVRNIKSAAYIGLEDYDSVIETLSGQDRRTIGNRPLNALVAAYLREDRADEAQALLEDILNTDPENYIAKIQLARVHASRDETERFEEILIEATESHPERDAAYELLYRRYLTEGRGPDAASLIERGLRVSPDSQALRVFKADVLLNQGNRAGALELYSDLIKERPDDRIIANNYVSLASDLRTDEASIARTLEIAKTIEELDNPFYRDTVGWAYYRAGQYDRALEYLSQAVAGAGNNADMLFHLGATQFATGDEANAKDNLEKAIEAGGPNFAYGDEARALLDRL